MRTALAVERSETEETSVPRGKRRRSIRALLLRGVMFFLLVTIVPVLLLRWIPPLGSAFMLQRQLGAFFRGEDAGIRYRWVGYGELSPDVRLAVVAAEDQKFPIHWGFDVQSIADAAEDNADRRRPRGASTITQQVAKNLFLWPRGGWVRKGLEAYFTVLIEVLWPKRRVLEIYLNVAEFGDRTYGVAAASDAFFSKPPSWITRHEAALLAAVLPNPRRFRAHSPSPYVERRAEWIEWQMSRLGDDYLAGLESRPRRAG